MASLLWVARVFAFTLIGFTLVAWVLIRRTRWGRQFWRLSRAYFIPQGRGWINWRPILTVALLLLFTVASVRLDVVLSYSSNGLYTALQELDPTSFWKFVGIFGVIATINVLLVLITYYIAQAQIIHWRQWLNQRMVSDWLSGSAYHRGRFVREPVDNPDQRIQQDVTSFASTSQDSRWARCHRWCRWSPSPSSSGNCPARFPSAASRFPGRWSSWPTST